MHHKLKTGLLALGAVVFLSACSTGQRVGPIPSEPGETVGQSHIDENRTYSSKYQEAMQLRHELYSKGLDYDPWKSHINDDLILMRKLNKKLSKEDLSKFNLQGYRFTSTRNRNLKSTKAGVGFVNYQSNPADFLLFLAENFSESSSKSKPVSRKEREAVSVTPVVTNRGKAAIQQQPVSASRKSNMETLSDDKIYGRNALIRYLSRGVQGEKDLQVLLYGIARSDCPYLYEYTVYPTRKGEIKLDNTTRAFFIDTRAVESQVIEACTK